MAEQERGEERSSRRGGDSGGPLVPRDDSLTEKLEEFIGEAFERGVVAEVGLLHVSHQGNNPVGDWTQFEGIAPENLAMQIMDRAVDDARAQRGSARYIVYYKRSQDKRNYDGRTWFTLTGGGYDIEGIEDTEGPNAHGLLSQMMRHNEASARIALLSARETIVDYRREVTELRGMVRHMTNTQFKVIELYEKLMSQEHQRSLDLRKARFDEAKQEKLFDQIGNIFPLLLAMFAEGKSEVLKDAAFKMQIKNLVGSLSEEQIAGIVHRLEAPQQIAFLELYRQLRESDPKSISAVVDQKAATEKAAAEKAEAEKAAAEKAEEEKKKGE